MRRTALLLDRFLTGIEAVAVIIALVLLMGLSSYQIVMRNIERMSPGWIDPLLHQLVLWAGFLGAALAVRSQAHIHFDLVAHRLSARGRARLNALLSLVSAVVSVLLAWASWHFVAEERSAVSEIAGIPSWVFALVIPASFGLMAVHFALSPLLQPVADAPGGAQDGSSPLPPPAVAGAQGGGQDGASPAGGAGEGGACLDGTPPSGGAGVRSAIDGGAPP
jgi:TRAP-type C4-dicarboxylate transport system permease small subunit